MELDDGVRGSAKRLMRAGHIDELCRLADAGDAHAARQFAGRLARTGRLDELLSRMAAGDRSARWSYSDWRVRRRRMPEAVQVLRPLAELGIPGAQRRLARLLAGLGRCCPSGPAVSSARVHRSMGGSREGVVTVGHRSWRARTHRWTEAVGS